jgi:hypothetical protein
MHGVKDRRGLTLLNAHIASMQAPGPYKSYHVAITIANRGGCLHLSTRSQLVCVQKDLIPRGGVFYSVSYGILRSTLHVLLETLVAAVCEY